MTEPPRKPLDYATPRPRPRRDWAPWVAFACLVALGVLAMLALAWVLAVSQMSRGFKD